MLCGVARDRCAMHGFTESPRFGGDALAVYRVGGGGVDVVESVGLLAPLAEGYCSATIEVARGFDGSQKLSHNRPFRPEIRFWYLEGHQTTQPPVERSCFASGQLAVGLAAAAESGRHRLTFFAVMEDFVCGPPRRPSRVSVRSPQRTFVERAQGNRSHYVVQSTSCLDRCLGVVVGRRTGRFTLWAFVAASQTFGPHCGHHARRCKGNVLVASQIPKPCRGPATSWLLG